MEKYRRQNFIKELEKSVERPIRKLTNSRSNSQFNLFVLRKSAKSTKQTKTENCCGLIWSISWIMLFDVACGRGGREQYKLG
jgi:hypothetical protein